MIKSYMRLEFAFIANVELNWRIAIKENMVNDKACSHLQSRLQELLACVMYTELNNIEDYNESWGPPIVYHSVDGITRCLSGLAELTNESGRKYTITL